MPKKINTSQLEKQDRIIDFYKRWNIDLKKNAGIASETES